MIHKYGVVIPNKYPDIIKPLIESIHKFIPEPRPDILIIADGHDNDYGFKQLPYPDPLFVFSKAVNIGIRTLIGKDVILLNDDCVLLEQDFFNRFYLELEVKKNVGILSPLIKGCVGNNYQRWHEQKRWWKRGESFKSINHGNPVCFPCVILKREMLREIGYMDESYATYGHDDENMCDRARQAGWITGITKKLTIQHGDGSDALDTGRGRSWSKSYARRFANGNPSRDEVNCYFDRNGIPKRYL